MEESGDLTNRKLSRYKNRVSGIIQESLEKSFWTSEKRKILDIKTNSLNNISLAPNDVEISLKTR